MLKDSKTNSWVEVKFQKENGFSFEVDVINGYVSYRYQPDKA
jgi:hypothetical protein